MLALVTLVEVFVSRHHLLLMDSLDLDWQTTSRLARQRASKCDILCFGDSMIKFGIAPRVLDASLDRPSYNLALLDGKPAASYYLFRRALAAGARPAAVLVDFQPEMIAQPAAHLLQNPKWNALMLEPDEALDMAWNYRDPSFFAQLMVARCLPTVRSRNQIHKNLRAALKGRSSPTRETNGPIRRNWQQNHGGILLARHPSYDGDVPDAMIGSLFYPDWQNEPTNTRYVERFLALASDARIPVFWLFPPNAPKVVTLRTENGIFGRYDTFVRGVQKRFDNVTVIDARRSGYMNSVFVDPIHLDRQGAAALSAAVASVIKTTLTPGAANSRWVTLPDYHEPRVGVGLEDVEQSKMALKLEETRVRR
jgi:hypothetical protein